MFFRFHEIFEVLKNALLRHLFDEKICCFNNNYLQNGENRNAKNGKIDFFECFLSKLKRKGQNVSEAGRCVFFDGFLENDEFSFFSCNFKKNML